MDLVAIFLARYAVILPPLILLHQLFLLPKREKLRFMFLVLFSIPLAYLIAKCGSQFYFNPRPYAIGGYIPLVPSGVENGFPSLHTTFAMTVALIVATKSRARGALLILIALLVGAARVYSGVHHGIDVLGGIVAAGAAVIITHRLLHVRLPVREY